MFSKNYLIMLILLAGLISCERNGKELSGTQAAVQKELSHYPESNLQDIYKSFFQNAYGPGHMISDTAMAKTYFERELKEMKQSNAVLWQPLGIDHNYYRVNLSLVTAGLLPKQDLFEAFVVSANEASPPSIKEWRGYWEAVVSEISQMEKRPQNFLVDSIKIVNMLDKRNFIIHHSESYSKTYFPHYRVVNRKQFEELYEKYLEGVDWEW